MLKYYVIALFLLSVIPSAYAEKATGVIEELRVCGSGTEKADAWIRTLVFKVGGIWFGTYAEHYNYNWGDADNSITTSLILMSYSQKLEIEVNATHSWVAMFKNCGIPHGYVFHSNAGDYIKLK